MIILATKVFFFRNYDAVRGIGINSKLHQSIKWMIWFVVVLKHLDFKKRWTDSRIGPMSVIYKENILSIMLHPTLDFNERKVRVTIMQVEMCSIVTILLVNMYFMVAMVTLITTLMMTTTMIKKWWQLRPIIRLWLWKFVNRHGKQFWLLQLFTFTSFAMESDYRYCGTIAGSNSTMTADSSSTNGFVS